MQQLFGFPQHQTGFDIAEVLYFPAGLLVLLLDAVQLLRVHNCVNNTLYPELLQFAFPVSVLLDALLQTHDTLQVFVTACHTQRIVIRAEQYHTAEYIRYLETLLL